MINNAIVRGVWRMMPDRRTVSFYIKTGEGTFTTPTPYTLYNVRRKPLQSNLTAIGGAAIKTKRAIFQIWQQDLDQASITVQPKAGDKIVESDGTTWIIDSDQDVEVKLIRNVFNCPCVKVPA